MTPSPIARTLAALIACQNFVVILIGPYLIQGIHASYKATAVPKIVFH
jgi:hypothetical protein